MSKEYIKVNRVTNSVVEKYNRQEFTDTAVKILSCFCYEKGIDYLVSEKQKLMYQNSFIKWYNKYYFLSGKTTYTVNRGTSNYNREDISKEQKYSFAKIIKRNPNYYTVFFINPESLLLNYNCFVPLRFYATFRNVNTPDQLKPVEKKHNFTLNYQKQRRWGVRNKHSFEKYYAKLCDFSYYKNLNEPIPRRMNGELGKKNTWSYWEDETVSEKGNWKRSTKCKHQWEPRAIRIAPSNSDVVKTNTYTLAMTYYYYNHKDIKYDLDELDYVWIDKNNNDIIDPKIGHISHISDKYISKEI